MPYVTLEITGPTSISVEGIYLDRGSSYGKEVSDATLEILRQFERNGYLKLVDVVVDESAQVEESVVVTEEIPVVTEDNVPPVKIDEVTPVKIDEEVPAEVTEEVEEPVKKTKKSRK